MLSLKFVPPHCFVHPVEVGSKVRRSRALMVLRFRPGGIPAQLQAIRRLKASQTIRSISLERTSCLRTSADDSPVEVVLSSVDVCTDSV